MFVMLICCGLSSSAQKQLSFNSFNEIFSYADGHSGVFKNANQEAILAKYQTLAAKLSIWNLKSDANFSATDNTKLATTFIPAEIFGGQAGTFKKVIFGQQFVTNLNITPQIDILNLYAIAKIRLSKVNEGLTRYNNLITKKNLYENLAGTYFNILSYKWEIAITENSLLNADTLTEIMQNKLSEGVARSQDVNDALANKLATKDKLQQLQIQLDVQYTTLKLLCDIDIDTRINIDGTKYPEQQFDSLLNANGNLEEQQQDLQKQ